MKYLFILFSVILISVSCHYIRGSGRIVTEKRATGDFRGLSVGGAFEVELKTGPVTEVIVEADDNIMSYIETNVRKGILRINTRGVNNFSDLHLKIFITAPLITNLTASASARLVTKDQLSSGNLLSFNASSAGSISADIDAPEVEAGASSGASVSLTGRTKSYKATVSSGGSINTYDLLSERTLARASSGGTVHVHASVELDANASSGATISYRGAANVQKTVSSGGNVERGE